MKKFFKWIFGRKGKPTVKYMTIPSKEVTELVVQKGWKPPYMAISDIVAIHFFDAGPKSRVERPTIGTAYAIIVHHNGAVAPLLCDLPVIHKRTSYDLAGFESLKVSEYVKLYEKHALFEYLKSIEKSLKKQGVKIIW